MSINANRREALPFVQQVLANDYTCEPDDFLADGVTINEFRPRPGGRGFTPPPVPFQAITFGRGIVIGCHADLIEPVRTLATRLDRDDFFNPGGLVPVHALLVERKQVLRGPSIKNLLTADRFTPSPGYLDRTSLIETDAVFAIKDLPGFPNSLETPESRLVCAHLAGITQDGDRVIAAAAACEETSGFWQIGVDVLPEARGNGLGLAIVSRVSAAILERGGLPYYSVAPSNIASRSIAHRLGYWPLFTEMYALPRDEH